MQRSAGNAATGIMVARAPTAQDQQTAPAKPDQQRLGQLREIALRAIDMYHTAADSGLSDAKGTVAETAWKPWAAALAGNLIWALAAFSTGGTAFVISLAGIGVGAVGTLPTSGAEFEAWAKAELIQKVVTHLEGQVDRVTRDVDAAVATQGWDDNKIRRELLGRLLRPEYIKEISGGIPTADREAMRHRVHADVLVTANRQVAEPFPMQNPGVVHYYYKVTGHRPAGYNFGDRLTATDKWQFAYQNGELSMEEGDDAAVAELKKDPIIRPAEWPLVKVVHISDDNGGFITLTLDSKNAFFRSHHNVVFSNVDGAAVIPHLWQGNGGLPPPIATATLK